MEKRSSKSRPESSAPKAQKKSSSKVSFDEFFARCVSLEMLRPWQRHEISVFFKEAGLREKEDLEVFEARLKKY